MSDHEMLRCVAIFIAVYGVAEGYRGSWPASLLALAMVGLGLRWA